MNKAKLLSSLDARRIKPRKAVAPKIYGDRDAIGASWDIGLNEFIAGVDPPYKLIQSYNNVVYPIISKGQKVILNKGRNVGQSYANAMVQHKTWLDANALAQQAWSAVTKAI